MEEKRPYYDQDFANEVREGLTSDPKTLSSKYFYDEKGDALFQQIMALPEYYLTDCEYEILDTYKQQLGRIFAAPEGFDLLELGAGDGKKTKILLKAFLQDDFDFTYQPNDISGNALRGLTKALEKDLPELKVSPRQGTYQQVLEQLGDSGGRRKVFLFLGSNIGNFSPTSTTKFLQKISGSMGDEDLLLVGMDQQKDPDSILKAYNDSAGVTAAFNLNLLTRINRELGANFNLNFFSHWPLYDPTSGEVRSYLISTKAQEVEIKNLNLSVTFRQWEAIHTEVSRKFNDEAVRQLAAASGLEIKEIFSDEKKYFKNYLFKKIIA